MREITICPVGSSKYGGEVLSGEIGNDITRISCAMCGEFDAPREVLEDSNSLGPKSKLSSVQRAALSHRIRTAWDSGTRPFITTDWLRQFLDDAALASPAEQVTGIIRFIGDHVAASGDPLQELPECLWTIVGSPNPEFAGDLVKQLHAGGLVSGIDSSTMDGISFMNVNLTLAGWERYDLEKRGRLSGNYGFLALKFNDPVLEPFVKDVIKPAVDDLGFRLVDMRDVAEPGVIDNILRERIRDAKFILADLTHDNHGAYWEAGYAEGLGKPVLYLCERKKFDEEKTHFDTNHCTTVIWGGEKSNEQFKKELTATLRNSLKLFPT